jgi:hypothetical protein
LTCRPRPGRGSWQSDSAEQPRGDSRSVRGLLGLGEAVSVFSAAASLPPDVAAFFAGWA